MNNGKIKKPTKEEVKAVNKHIDNIVLQLKAILEENEQCAN